MIPAHLIDDLVELEWWQGLAACRHSDSELFFPGRGESADAARAICAECPVISNCLEMALDENLTMGIFGGKTPRVRRVIRNQRRSAARRAKSA